MLQDYKLGFRMLLKYPVVMGAAGLLACAGPARRALRINPIDALRDA